MSVLISKIVSKYDIYQLYFPGFSVIISTQTDRGRTTRVPYRIIIAANHQNLIQMICGVLRLLTLSCIVTLTTTAADQMMKHVCDHEPHLLILGFNRKNAQAAIRGAKEARPRLRVLWLGETDEPLPEADATLACPVTPLRLVEAVSRAMK